MAARVLGGADLLRRIVANMDDTPEWFNDRYTAEELVRIYTAHLATDWDMGPHRWASAQVAEAARAGVVPKFDNEGRPL